METLRMFLLYSDPWSEKRFWEDNGKPEGSAWSLLETLIEYHDSVNPDNAIGPIELNRGQVRTPVSRYDQEEL